MKRIEKTVFISYRRTNFPWALAVSQDLTHHGYDVFLDFTGIASGDFERVILENIAASARISSSCLALQRLSVATVPPTCFGARSKQPLTPTGILFP
jgi:TIR domain